MGFATILEILGSIVVGGFLMVLLWRLDDSATASIINNTGELSIQQNLAVIAEILEFDFRKIGYCATWSNIPDPSKSIIAADSTSITFLTDVDKDGSVDTMRYYLGPASELTSTPNPRDRILYRVVNHDTPNGVNLGVTQFHINYFNSLGDSINLPITEPGEIATMEINICVENTSAYDEQYSSAFWRQIRMVARNLRNR